MTRRTPPSRRRAAPPKRERVGRTGLSGLALVAVAAGAVALTAPAGEVARSSTGSAGTLVNHSVLACPSSPAASGAHSASVVGSLPGGGLGSGGSVRQGPRAGAGNALQLRRGGLLGLSGPGSVLTGDGQLAAGLFGFRSDVSAAPAAMAVASCTGPRRTWWFGGAGAGLDHSSELVLSNVDVGPAVVDLHVVGGNSATAGAGTRGVTIPPGTSKRVPLSSVAPQVNELSLGVSASRGRVVASVDDAFSASPGGPVGHEWLAGGAAPSRRLRLAGLPEKATSRQLLLANPSDRDAVVEVRVSGSGGQFVPAGLSEQTLAPGAVKAVDLGKDVGHGESAAVTLQSQVPVLATVRSLEGSDTAYASAVDALSGPAAAPVPAHSRTTMQLTAGARPATATVAAYDAHGRLLEHQRLSLKQTATMGWSPKPGAAYVVVTPGSGQLFGAAVYEGTGVSATPLTTLPVRYLEPSVVPAVH